jgi:single-strand DNA-binding protein
MANEPVITLIGNLTADPELRFTQAGTAVANFSVASTPRSFDKRTGGWKDGQALFMRCTVWQDAAENVAETLRRGMRVIVSGRLQQRSFETREGEKRTVVELQVDEIGPSLRWAVATVEKAGRNSQPRPSQHTDQGTDQATDDVWGDAPADRELVGAGAGGDTPPF